MLLARRCAEPDKLSTARVVLQRIDSNPGKAFRSALEQAGLVERLTGSTRVALKPNFTYPYYKRGVTTSPLVIREVVRVLREYTSHIAIVETDGGYGVWKVAEAFEGHDVFKLRGEFGVEVVNLGDEA